MNILNELTKKYPTGDQLAHAFGSKFRQTGWRWMETGVMPVKYWDDITRILPGVTIEDCYDQFVRKHMKPKKQSKTRH